MLYFIFYMGHCSITVPLSYMYCCCASYVQHSQYANHMYSKPMTEQIDLDLIFILHFSATSSSIYLDSATSAELMLILTATTRHRRGRRP
jgi:hypothetical protein